LATEKAVDLSRGRPSLAPARVPVFEHPNYESAQR
jgi:hypothetical protein